MKADRCHYRLLDTDFHKFWESAYRINQQQHNCRPPTQSYRSNCQRGVERLFSKVTEQQTQNASFLAHITTLGNESENIEDSKDTQVEFDQFYCSALNLLNRFYPENTITLTSRDPEFVTPAIKASLRRKNRLMHSGRV